VIRAKQRVDETEGRRRREEQSEFAVHKGILTVVGLYAFP
jgi:hypothetical protein